jgi:hypothetical protein
VSTWRGSAVSRRGRTTDWSFHLDDRDILFVRFPEELLLASIIENLLFFRTDAEKSWARLWQPRLNIFLALSISGPTHSAEHGSAKFGNRHVGVIVEGSGLGELVNVLLESFVLGNGDNGCATRKILIAVSASAGE